MTELAMSAFLVGLAAFSIQLFMNLRSPELAQEPEPGERRRTPLRRWDRVLTWIMWIGWGAAMVLYYLEDNGYLSKWLT